MKTCFKCGIPKPITDFYVHRMMADGHLGKCKVCTRIDVALRITRKKQDLEWVLDERARCREKTIKARIAGKQTPSSNDVKRRWQKRNPHKVKAELEAAIAERSGIIQRPDACQECGSPWPLQRHHPDYSQPLFVRYLCTKCHGRAHWKLTF